MTAQKNGESELDRTERREARRRQAPSAAVVYEAIRAEAESELARPLSALAWSGLAAGLSMGFSFIAQALLRTLTPNADWMPIISSLGYSMGFLIVILGRQQLFTENTLTPVLEVLQRRDRATVVSTLRLWAIVLAANMIGVTLFALVLSCGNILGTEVEPALREIAASEYGPPFGTVFVRAIFAGWLVALMVWLLPFAESARVTVIILVSYTIGLAHFPHVIAGSAAALYGVFDGSHTVGAFFGEFFVPTLLGNMVGGLLMVAAINYGQVSSGSETDETDGQN